MTTFDQGLVLIVEEDRNTAALVATDLEREGFSTLAVHDGRQALSKGTFLKFQHSLTLPMFYLKHGIFSVDIATVAKF
jgi:CheY-like chemotaxis protein